MWSTIRSRLTYANIVSTACLFIVLGGTSYAVATGSIDSREIKNNTVQSKDVRNGTLGTTDISRRARAALRGTRGLTGPQGPQGVQGAPGPRGSAGATQVVVRRGQSDIPANTSASATAECLPGERATGGGWDIVSIPFAAIVHRWGGPVPDQAGSTPTGWDHSVFNTTAETGTLRVYAVCASP